MSTGTENQAQPEAAEGSLYFPRLQQVIEATTQTPADTTKELVFCTDRASTSGTRPDVG